MLLHDYGCGQVVDITVPAPGQCSNAITPQPGLTLGLEAQLIGDGGDELSRALSHGQASNTLCDVGQHSSLHDNS